MKAVYSIEISVDVPATTRTGANVEAVDRWQAVKTQIEALDGVHVELKRMRLATADPGAGEATP